MMETFVIHSQEGSYVPWPQLSKLSGDKLSVGVTTSPTSQHPAVGLVGDWMTLESNDLGSSWLPNNDPKIPHNWPGATTREKQDRFADVMPDGSYLCAGSTGWELWPVDNLRDANENLRRYAKVGITHEGEGKILVGGQRLFAQRSTDRGQTWTRREWTIPGFRFILSISRGIKLSNGTVLIPTYGTTSTGENGWHDKDEHTYVWRSEDAGLTWRLFPLGDHVNTLHDNETAFLEIGDGKVIALSRTQPSNHDDAYLIQRWSDDSGRTWSYPLRTEMWGYPPHLLKLRDGRILCTYGYRRDPMGIRAVLSNDKGESWDTKNEVILRDDGGGTSSLNPNPTGGGADIGYPISVQMDDNTIITAYYITLSDGVTHSAITRWKP